MHPDITITVSESECWRLAGCYVGAFTTMAAAANRVAYTRGTAEEEPAKQAHDDALARCEGAEHRLMSYLKDAPEELAERIGTVVRSYAPAILDAMAQANEVFTAGRDR